MPQEQNEKHDPAAHVPEPLRRIVRKQVPLKQVTAWAAYDLNEEGMYVQGYLALARISWGISSAATADGRASG